MQKNKSRYSIIHWKYWSFLIGLQSPAKLTDQIWKTFLLLIDVNRPIIENNFIDDWRHVTAVLIVQSQKVHGCMGWKLRRTFLRLDQNIPRFLISYGAGKNILTFNPPPRIVLSLRTHQHHTEFTGRLKRNGYKLWTKCIKKIRTLSLVDKIKFRETFENTKIAIRVSVSPRHHFQVTIANKTAWLENDIMAASRRCAKFLSLAFILRCY